MENLFKKEISDFKKYVEKVDYVSFDIFDTLLVRPYQRPCDLFLQLEIQYNMPGFAYERMRAECRARNNNQPCEDINFDKIYFEIQEKYKCLKEHEINLEMLVLKPHPIMKSLYDYAIKKNKKIIVISDMYLPQNFLKNVLAKNGYTNIEKFYISGEIGKCKNTGALYEYVLKDLNVKPEKILHIGDNLNSDYVRACESGIKALHIEDCITKFEKTLWGERFKLLQGTHNSLDYSILKALVAQKLVFNSNEYWYNFAYILGGALALAYTQFVFNRAKFLNIKQLLFISRDGYLLEKIFNLFQDKSIKSHYIYAPRILNLKCFYDFRNNTEYFNKLISIMNNAGYNLNYSQDIGITPADYVNENKEIFENYAVKHRSEYKKYLDSLDILNSNIATVDGVTVSFSTQSFLKKIFQQSLEMGFYLVNFSENNELIYNSFFDLIKYKKNEVIVCIWELLLTSPEPPISDLKDCKPVYLELNEFTELRIELFKIIELAIMDFAKDYLTFFNGSNIVISSNLIKDLYGVFEKTLTKQDKKNLNSINHSADVCNTDYVPIYPMLTLKQKIINFVIRFKNRGRNFIKKKIKNFKFLIKVGLYKCIK